MVTVALTSLVGFAREDVEIVGVEVERGNAREARDDFLYYSSVLCFLKIMSRGFNDVSQ